MSPLQIITLTLALVAYGSFIWSVKGFFGVPKGGMPPLMKALSVLGLVNMIASVFFMVNHFATLPIFIGAAIGFYAASTALFWWAIRTHRKKPLAIAFTEHVPEHVVSEGPHRFVRHPFYTSYLLAWMGGSCSHPTPCLRHFIIHPAWVLCASRTPRRGTICDFRHRF